ncbi:MAG: 2OG-Fe(II) oxygenase [Oscillatoria sp. PMC 1051.18]|nr:2OG-Fe(II) oxygenase [Oscillatoria sp. PMC 1050.18]MEC5029303.1 2OG-Fe(II) oxygenase [Oscillatoria sp. PMC 1051.18]
MRSLLAKVTKDDVFTEPFPHIIIKDPLDEDLCKQLFEEFPTLDQVTEGKKYASNERFSYSAAKVLKDTRISPLWREFVATHVSQSFLTEFIELFKDEIRQVYPDFEKEFGKLETLTAGTRKKDSFETVDVLLDGQICVNTPVGEKPSSVRGPHVDSTNKLFAGLYYLRDPKDTSTGGDLEIYKFKTKDYQFEGQFISDEYVETIKTVKYERNVLVLFVNSIDSLHGVTVRETTDCPRYFFNLLGEVKKNLFSFTPEENKHKQQVREKQFKIPIPASLKALKRKLSVRVTKR